MHSKLQQQVAEASLAAIDHPPATNPSDKSSASVYEKLNRKPVYTSYIILQHINAKSVTDLCK